MPAPEEKARQERNPFSVRALCATSCSAPAAHPRARRLATRVRAFLRDRRGSIYIEYIIILTFAAVLVVKFVGPKAGGKIVSEYLGRRVILYATTP